MTTITVKGEKGKAISKELLGTINVILNLKDVINNEVKVEIDDITIDLNPLKGK